MERTGEGKQEVIEKLSKKNTVAQYPMMELPNDVTVEFISEEDDVINLQNLLGKELIGIASLWKLSFA